MSLSANLPRTPVRRRAVRLAGPLLLAVLAGCVSKPPPPSGTERRALRPVPEVFADYLRADRAIVAAFFAANGVRLSAAQAEELIPSAAPPGRIDRPALRRAATRHNRVAVAVQADRRYLWKALDRNLPLLLYFPPDLRYHPAVALFMPVAWDRQTQAIDLLDGNGEILAVPEAEFFARREPLKDAALCLAKPGALARAHPTREQQLVLADFWFDKGFYRRADAAYAAVEAQKFLGTADVDALVGRGNVLFREGKYKDAIPVYRAALALEPDNPRILNNLACTMLGGQTNLLTALRHASKAQRLDPDNPLYLETLGSVNLRLGDAATAARHLEEAWARASRHPPETQIAIMDQLVRAWIAADRLDLAWQVAATRQRTFPRHRFPRDITATFPSLRRPPPAQPPAP